MRSARALATAFAAFAALVVAGCGLGPGDSTEGAATLTVTRDYGSTEVTEAEVRDPSESETVMRFLDREAKIETRYGGGFVQSIEGIEGDTSASRSLDWFFYVNGVESEVGAAEVDVRAGDRVWWDYRDWTEAMRVPAVVGSWPEPFLQASASSERMPVRIECAGEDAPCDSVEDGLADAGVNSAVQDPRGESSDTVLRIVVGAWAQVKDDPAARLLARAPAASGVFARFDGDDLVLLDEEGDERLRGQGIVAAVRDGETQPTWLITGVDDAGVLDAAKLVDPDTLRDRYAVASVDGSAIPVPFREDID